MGNLGFCKKEIMKKEEYTIILLAHLPHKQKQNSQYFTTLTAYSEEESCESDESTFPQTSYYLQTEDSNLQWVELADTSFTQGLKFKLPLMEHINAICPLMWDTETNAESILWYSCKKIHTWVELWRLIQKT